MELIPLSKTSRTPADRFTGDGDGTTWLEPVTDDDYAAASSR